LWNSFGLFELGTDFKAWVRKIAPDPRLPQEKETPTHPAQR